MDWLPLKEFCKYFLHKQHPNFHPNYKIFLSRHFYTYLIQNDRESSSLYILIFVWKLEHGVEHTFLQIFQNQKQHFPPFCTKFKKFSIVCGIYECHYYTILFYILYTTFKIFKKVFRSCSKKMTKKCSHLFAILAGVALTRVKTC